MINSLSATRVPSAITAAACAGVKWWNVNAITARSKYPSRQSISVASATSMTARGWLPSSPSESCSTDVASMSVTVTLAVGCCSSSLRDSAPCAAPSSRIFGSGTSASSSSAINANFSWFLNTSPVHSSARTTLRLIRSSISSRSRSSRQPVSRRRSSQDASGPPRGIVSMSVPTVAMMVHWEPRPTGAPELADFVASIDQGTTSTRCMIFDQSGSEVGRHQLEHDQVLPRAGWVEHNPVEIWERTTSVLASALNNTHLSGTDLAAMGITNQRETTEVWNRDTGRPYYNAIVWQDTRTDKIASALDRDGRGDVIRRKAGLPPATYFSGGKLQWILENVDGVREAAENGDAIFGTTDCWVVWNLTGGPRGGVHVTDVTNASRTMLMNLETLDWDDELLSFFGIPRQMLPEIRPSSSPEPYGTTQGPLDHEVPITGILGDQQAAMVGQVCFDQGEAKNTYGTGNFLLLNTGENIVRSDNGLITTVCYRFGDAKPVYALEGSIAVTGSAVQWLRDQLGIISGAAQSETLARQVEDNGGVYFVPAFSGLFAPYWRSDARGAIVGLSRYNTNAHLARATLEAICYQSRDVA